MDLEPHLGRQIVGEACEGILLPALKPLGALPLGLLFRESEVLLFLIRCLLVGLFLFALPEPIELLLALFLEPQTLDFVLKPDDLVGGVNGLLRDVLG